MRLTELDDVADLLLTAFAAMSLLLTTLVLVEGWLTRPRSDHEPRR